MDSYPESLSGMQLRSGIPTPNMGVTGHHGTPVAMNTPSNASRAATPTTVDSSSPIVQHKVTKRDTLAGLAIRYNVSVGDIKRANGLLSDNALYARDTIHIPTGGVPLGEELQLIFAQVAAGIGRDPVLNADANLHPASAAAARVARIINNTDTSSFMPDDPGLPWWCRCGTCDEDENRVACRSRRFTDSEEERTDFELQEVLLPPESASGPTRMSANMTRRHGRSNQEGGAEDQPGGGSSASAPGDSRPYGKPPRTRGLPPPPPGGPALQGEGIASVMRQITDFGKSLGDLSLVQRIKAAANQPALAAGPKGKSQSFASAAEGVLGSLKAGMRPASQRKSDSGSGMGSPMLPRSHGADAGNNAVPQRRREGGKTD